MLTHKRTTSNLGLKTATSQAVRPAVWRTQRAIFLSTALCLLSGAVSTASAAQPTLTVGSASGQAGTSVNFPITFDQMALGATVKIFTVSGHLVKTLTPAVNSVTWDLTNDSGDKVASGVYLYLITDGQGNKARGKLAVIK